MKNISLIFMSCEVLGVGFTGFCPCLVPARAPLILVKLALEGFYPTITIKKYCNKMGSLQMGYQ
jgi:hypothetical protein